VTTPADVVKGFADMAVVDLVAIGQELFALIGRKSSEQTEVAAARAAGDAAVDALEKTETGGP
jgi:hypothetical protein